MKINKWMSLSAASLLSLGMLAGCNAPNDEKEPDPTEEPSEQNDEMNKNDDKDELKEEQENK
ncbi:hypothetical protein GKZ89_08375 [Bacillus mangrovi]|uniref:Lipoprotein n=1 Tax=Metabacillus mangrovi TaxID=1491830 RepID=A0A7X2V4S7_9BACI|nr:hypothetical protein [Metabacillus mangrovi]MTH53431.1 hypothetical protein [Metabacillus mangrovi]